MTAAAVGPVDVVSKIALDRQCADLLLEVANAAFGGNRSAAIRHLILVHAGREAAKAAEASAQVDEVDSWRKRGLTMELVREVAVLLRQGSVRADAYRIAGVTADQAKGWDRAGAVDVKALRASVPAQWVMVLARAEAEYKRDELRTVKDGKWKLERSYPAEYGRRSTTDATVTHRSLPMIDLERLTVEEARVFLTLARKASPQGDDPGISARARPIGELLPADIDGEASELPEKPGR